MNLLIALLLILAVGFYLCFAVAMLLELMQNGLHKGSQCRALGRSRGLTELFESDRTMAQRNRQVPSWLLTVVGAASCVAAAALLSFLFRNSSFNTTLPLWFLLIIVFVANRVGPLAGVLGTILAEAIFAFFMFVPLYSIAVQNQAARNNLLWMFFGGLALSELFGNRPPDPGKPTAHHRAG